MYRLVFALAATLATTVAAAQGLPPPPLDLNPAPATTTDRASATTKPAAARSSNAARAPALPDSPPGVYYGDTSGRIYPARPQVAAAKCDDATYGQAETHGSVGMGVMGGSRVSGNYETATVNMTKRLGSCEDPKGAVGITINIGQGNFHGRGW